jgi:hypothetical protein
MSLADVIGRIPYRLALSGGWIDQPFVSRLHPNPPGAMVVVGLEPQFYFMDRCGLATSTRKAARRLWNGRLPDRDPESLIRELYGAENRGRGEPSGSQDMAGLIYPGISRLEYDPGHEGGLFPVRVESLADADTAAWLEGVIRLLPVNQRPEGYNPLAVRHLDGNWIRRLGDSGFACYDAIANRDLRGLGESLNETVRCWDFLLPHVVRPPALDVDLMGLLAAYQKGHPGAMFSGCGGGYLIVASEESIPGSFRIKVRTCSESPGSKRRRPHIRPVRKQGPG